MPMVKGSMRLSLSSLLGEMEAMLCLSSLVSFEKDVAIVKEEERKKISLLKFQIDFSSSGEGDEVKENNKRESEAKKQQFKKRELCRKPPQSLKKGLNQCEDFVTQKSKTKPL